MLDTHLRSQCWADKEAGKPLGSIMHIDLETQNQPFHGAVASPRHPDNYVVAVGWAVDEQPYSGEVCYSYFNSKEEATDWFHIPDNVWLIVAHNAAYEMDWFLHDARDKFIAFLARGGKIFCTQYGHYLLSNQQDTYPALSEIAPKYGGTPKVDGVKALWDAGVLTADIDRDLLIEYLAGPSGDIDNTRKVFYGEWQQLTDRGMLKMAMTRMDGLIFNAMAMNSGLKLNRELAFAQLKIQETRLNELVQQFAKHRANFPEQAVFKESSAFHMSAWLYGGPLKYKARLPYSYDGSPEQYVKADFYRFSNGTHRITVDRWDAKTPEERADLEFNFGSREIYKSGKNKGLPKVFREDTAEVKMKWWDQIYECPGLVDLSLLGKELHESFLEEWTGKRKLADGSPVISTAGDPIEQLAQRKEFPEHVRLVLEALNEFAKLDKDLGTYYLREQYDEEGNVIKQAGMLQYLNDDDIVNHNLNATSTVTTRLSSNKPNFQNLPRGGTSDVKKMFVSRFGKDGVVIEADYSALEVVTLAAFTKDQNLINALLAGTDMHCLRLANQLGEEYTSVLLKCKDQTHPQHESYDLMRTNIKPKAFQYQYGATAYGIAFSTGCTVEDAQAFIDSEKALFPDVERWYEDVVFPQVEASTVRRREECYDKNGNPYWRLYGVGTYVAPGGTTFEFRQWPKNVWANGKKTEVMQYKPTQMRNYPIQGESGFFVQGMCGQFMRWAVGVNFLAEYSEDGKTPMFHIINTVHDAIYVDCHLKVLDIVAENLKRIMEELPKFFGERHGYELGVPFPAAVEFGATMYHKIHWHKGVLDEAGVTKDGKYHPSAREQLAAQHAEIAEIIAAAEAL